MVGKIIREYLESGHKKVTVPGFGTFMRKDSGEIIFVDLIRKDDGVLRELVEDYGNYGEVEAMALVDRFIFEIKHSIERNGSAPIDGFGTMFLDEKGLYQFDYTPQPKPVKENPVQEKLFPEEKQAVEKPGANTPKSTNADHKAGASTPSAAKPAPVPTPEHKPTQKPRPAAKKPAKGNGAKIDKWIVIAIVAAAIAILIIVYGLSGSGLPFLK